MRNLLVPDHSTLDASVARLLPTQHLEIMPEEEKQIIIRKINEPEKIVNIEPADAFRIYLEMGIERSIKKVSKRMEGRGISTRILQDWCKKFGWVAKAEEYDRKAHEQSMELALKKALKSKIDILAICQKVFSRFEQVLKGDKIILTRRKKDGTIEEEVRMNRYNPDFADIQRAYEIIKQELGEGLPDWQKVKEINLTQVFQQIINNANKKQNE